jgi:UDP-2,4-diacetamido-2,4,6-trideoxy-beta-L-altropyranose hydrolase
MKIIIRADSSSTIGSGHIMRCLVLADALKTEAIFACRDLPGNIISVIESRGFACKKLPANLDDANRDFLDFLRDEKFHTLIIDNYDTDIGLEKKARHYVQKIAVIDDLANRKHDCDILIDQNPCEATHARYQDLIPTSAITLFGLKYALLGKDFAAHKKTNFSKEINNILIFFGGGDHKNLTQKTIETLINTDIKFDVVVGSSNQNKEKIRKLCEANPNFTFHCQINNMAELMQAADLFIGAGGTTSWERMCVGLPGIIISIADNQVESCNALVKFDVAKYLGTAEEFAPQKLLDSLEWAGKNPDWLANAAQNSQKMVAGFGAKLVAAVINSSAIELKPARPYDCGNIFSWRNDKQNRRYSLNSKKIIFAQHKQWFEKITTSDSSALLVAYYKDQPLGVVRFDYEGEAAEISLYLVPGQHGKGLGLPLLYASETWLKNNHPVTAITAKVLPANEASVKIFQYALYNVTGNDNNVLLFNKSIPEESFPG